MVKSPWFIAVIPPEAIQERVTSLKKEAAARFDSRHALTSPPHVTLIAPFMATAEEIPALSRALSTFVKGRSSFEMKLQGFGNFPPRVIYVDVVPNPRLTELQKALEGLLQEQFSFPLRKYPVFHPHMTIAFRDLKPTVFDTAWTFFNAQSFQASFSVKSIFLLQHREGRWHVFENFFLD